jgi:hypothetical protein
MSDFAPSRAYCLLLTPEYCEDSKMRGRPEKPSTMASIRKYE